MKYILTLTYSIVILGLISSCSQPDKQAQLEELKKKVTEINQEITTLETEIAASDTSQRDLKFTNVTVMPLKPQPFKNYITIQGKVDADQNVSISAEMPGMITKICVKPGQEVSTGQILAEIDNSTIVQGVAELQNALEFATNLYNKQKNLWDQKIGTEIQFLSAKNQKESLEKKWPPCNRN
jgi:multidrug efflux pump subunit AcrA (membrane-fusion protein)